MNDDTLSRGAEPELPAHDDRAGDGPEAAAAAPEPTPVEPEAPDVVRQQRDEFRDLWLRRTAEFDNYRKRVERERRDLAEGQAVDLLKELLPLVDSLERALAPAADEASVAAYRQGVALIHRQLLDLLARRGVTVVDPLGTDFDPHLHEAVMREPAADRRDGEVVEVFSRGYLLGGRLLRPAMVKVATA